jgi:hypothetical protein
MNKTTLMMGEYVRRLPLFLLILAFAAGAQEETKEMRTLRLQLRQAELERTQSQTSLSTAEANYKEAQALFEKGLCSKVELANAEEVYNRARVGLEQSTINLEKTSLAFLNDALYISLQKAVLYRDADGRKHALLTISNQSDVRKLVGEDEQSGANRNALLTIENLTVRILNEGKLIGRPFEYKVGRLGYKQARAIDFVLQRETEAVTVELAYGDTVIHLPVFLEKEAKEDRVLVEALQFSLEGELGTRVTYDFSLERFVDDDKTFTLEVLNLPPDYSYEFREMGEQQAGSADRRVSRIRFKKGLTTKGMQLVLNMPKEIAKDELNQKIQFFVLVLDRYAQQRLATAKSKSEGRPLQAEELEAAGLSFETLELVPRGRAEVTIEASLLFVKVKLGEPIKWSFTLHNTGTVKLDRIRVYLGLPLDWTAAATPEKDITLDVEGKQRVDVEILPAADVVASDYEIKVETKTLHEGRDVDATPKIMRIQIEGKSNILIGSILMIVLIGMIVGVAVMTIKISRR